jgi:hypothetical protein
MKENISVEAWDMLHALRERNLPQCDLLVLFLRGRHVLSHLGKQLFRANLSRIGLLLSGSAFPTTAQSNWGPPARAHDDRPAQTEAGHLHDRSNRASLIAAVA